MIMPKAFVSAGSNIDPENNLRKAIRLIRADVRVLALSTVYRTAPIGRPGQPFYYNSVLRIETGLPPVVLKYKVLRRIEAELGRTRSSDKFAPRTIDLDLLLYDSLVTAEKDLVLPDPDILLRPFLIAALNEIAPDLILPGSTLSLAEAAKSIPAGSLQPLREFTEMLRKELRHGMES